MLVGWGVSRLGVCVCVPVWLVGGLVCWFVVWCVGIWVWLLLVVCVVVVVPSLVMPSSLVVGTPCVVVGVLGVLLCIRIILRAIVVRVVVVASVPTTCWLCVVVS